MDSTWTAVPAALAAGGVPTQVQGNGITFKALSDLELSLLVCVQEGTGVCRE